ncbi:MAG: hypothetical protein MZU97_03315 [Bacillus subtilis]|nr:hypothetical protein [Bacillus subtilis]
MTTKNSGIVESPAKSRTTARRHPGPDFEVACDDGAYCGSSQKAIRDRSPEKDFSPEYEVIPEKKEVVADLKKKAEKHGEIYSCRRPGPRRRGHQLASPGNPCAGKGRPSIGSSSTKSRRRASRRRSSTRWSSIRINSIPSRPAELSIVSWDTKCLRFSGTRSSSGDFRPDGVQTVALRIICEREDEIDAFIQEEYRTIEAHLDAGSGNEVEARLLRRSMGSKVGIGNKAADIAIVSREEAGKRDRRAEMKGLPFRVTAVDRKQRGR